MDRFTIARLRAKPLLCVLGIGLLPLLISLLQYLCLIIKTLPKGTLLSCWVVYKYASFPKWLIFVSSVMLLELNLIGVDLQKSIFFLLVLVPLYTLCIDDSLLHLHSQEEQKSSIKMANIMEAPLCLIENLEDGTLRVNPEAINLLSRIDQPVVVVSVVGMYRTGKSYLMNKLAGAQSGFELGATVKAKTKGIWMWCIPHPTKINHTLVLLDTEGLGDVVKGDNGNDMKIFCLSVLLSSTLIYNSQKTIDQDAIEKLGFVSELSQFIKVKSNNNDNEEGEFSSHFPNFIWAVRDFTLKLEENGEDITEDNYLENALRLQKTDVRWENQQRIKKGNQCRECIRMYFKTRKCFVFDLPSGNSNVLQRMDKVSEEELKPEFVTQTHEFCKYIYSNAEVKYLDYIHSVTGNMLGQLVHKYTEDIISFNAVCMENSVDSISKTENEAAVQEATEHYKKTMRERGQFPTETLEEFIELSAQCEEESLQIFMKRSFKDSELLFQKHYMENIQKKKQDFLVIDRTESHHYCEQLITKHSKELNEALKKGLYCALGGYSKFQDAMKKIEERYYEEPRKGVQAYIVLREFVKSMETTRISIMKADKTLTEQQKAAENKLNKKIEELEREIREQKLLQEKKIAEDEKRADKRNLEELLEKERKEKEEFKEKLESLKEGKKREEDSFCSEGCPELAKMVKKQRDDWERMTLEKQRFQWVDFATDIGFNAAKFAFEIGFKLLAKKAGVRLEGLFHSRNVDPMYMQHRVPFGLLPEYMNSHSILGSRSSWYD